MNADENLTLASCLFLLSPILSTPAFSSTQSPLSSLFLLSFPFPYVLSPLLPFSSPFPTPVLVPYKVRGVKIFSLFSQHNGCLARFSF